MGKLYVDADFAPNHALAVKDEEIVKKCIILAHAALNQQVSLGVKEGCVARSRRGDLATLHDQFEVTTSILVESVAKLNEC